MDQLRKRLLDRINQFSSNQLSVLERLFDAIESGDLSALSSFLASEKSTSDHQQLAAQILAKLKGGDQSSQSKDWPHAPVHRISEYGTYIVTSGTIRKQHLFRGPERLDLMESTLLRVAKQFGWQLEAWAVFSNHYHIVAHALDGAQDLGEMLKQLHGETACEINKLDGVLKRKVWHNFWDTKLTFEKSYLARLNYVHQNAVKHRLVPVANQYHWSSAAWFERTATRAQVKTIYSFRTDKVKVRDAFDPV